MDNTAQLEEAVAAALKLPPRERLRLIERVASSVEREIDAPPAAQPAEEEHWGRSLNALLDTLDMSEWEAIEIDDPVEWVKQLREKGRKGRHLDWGEPE